MLSGTPYRLAVALSVGFVISAVLYFGLLAGSDATSAHAQTADTPTPVLTPVPNDSGVENLPPLEGKLNPPKYPNMDSNLNRIVLQVETGQSIAQAAAANAPLHQEDSVAVTLYIIDGYASAIVKFLEGNGASPRNIGTDYIEAYVPVPLLAEASAQEDVISIHAITPPRPAQGSAVSEGTTVHGAPAWHAAGYKGQGVRVGIIDTGFEGFGSLMGTQLPSSVEARCYSDVDAFTFNHTDCENENSHGTAVTEAAFDIAPEATYYIANPISFGDLSATVDWMNDQDVDVINMSLSWVWSGPGDGTSPFSDSPLRAVDTAVTGGITWVNAAGSAATDTWFGEFTDSDGDSRHNFAANDNCNTFVVEEGDLYIKAYLRWDDDWLGSSLDLDLALYRVFPFTGTTLRILPILAGGANIQDGEASDIPFERVFYITFFTGTYCLAVQNFSDTSPDWFQLQIWSLQDLEHYTSGGSIVEPADSANSGLLAAGAAPWDDTSTIEEFSSRGPTPDDRIKPDIVGADNVYSGAYGENFPGTSQASPHVAGMAALVQQRFPDYTPQQIANYLKTHASARGTVPNNTWGHGFARLLSSDVATATPAPTVTPGPSPTPEPTVTPPADSCVKTISADGTVNGSWDSNCASESRSGSYARFYTFSFDEPRDVAITLESEVDTYLYVREGEGTDGHIVHEDDDDDHSVFSLASSTDSGISESLSAGAYTIEATTVTAGETGEFTLTIRGVTGAYDALFDRYDTDGDGQINKPEVIAAVRDYLGGQITKAQVVEVIRHYIIGPPPASDKVYTLRELAELEDEREFSDPDIRIRVQAYVNFVRDDIGDLILWIRDAGYSEYCYFDEAHRTAVTALSEGEQVTVDGTFNGLWLRDCVLVSRSGQGTGNSTADLDETEIEVLLEQEDRDKQRFELRKADER